VAEIPKEVSQKKGTAVIPKKTVQQCNFTTDDTRKAIEKAAGGDKKLRSILMGMAYAESRFDPCAVGDNGNATGAFQIWHSLHGREISKAEILNPYSAAKWTAGRLKKAGYSQNKITLSIQTHNGLVPCRANQPCSNGYWTGYAESVKRFALTFR
jgi:soluble lytic murein transglycosylase-like protein